MKRNETKRNETKPDQTRPDQTRPDQTKPDQTKPNQIKPNTRPNRDNAPGNFPRLEEKFPGVEPLLLGDAAPPSPDGPFDGTAAKIQHKKVFLFAPLPLYTSTEKIHQALHYYNTIDMHNMTI